MFDGSVIDACAFHEWPSSAVLEPYMTSGWAAAIRRDGDRAGRLPVTAVRMYDSPLGRKRTSARPAAGVAGSDPQLLIDQLFGDGRRERVVLGYDDGIYATSFMLPYYSRSIVSAANDWTIEHWLERDDRLYGQVLVTSSMPEEAAAEIRRAGSHPKMVAVALGTNGLGRPFGFPAYFPIYEAAAELDLPLVLQWGSEGSADLAATPTPMSPPATYGEYEALAAIPMMHHSMSMIMSGVFDRWPNLQVLLVGGGACWIPTCMWRCDYQFQLSPGVEAPWMQGMPSSYLVEHFKVGTYSLESPPDVRQLHAVLNVIPNIENMLMYTSCYPNSDSEEPNDIAARVPEQWHARVFHDNAMAFYRWPDRPPRDRKAPAVTQADLRDRTTPRRRSTTKQEVHP